VFSPKNNDFEKIKNEYFQGHAQKKNLDIESSLLEMEIRMDKERRLRRRCGIFFSQYVDLRFFIRPYVDGHHFKAFVKFISLIAFEFVFYFSKYFLYTRKKFVFIVGMPHTGTTLLQRVLNSHQDITGTKGELNTYFMGNKYFSNHDSHEIDSYVHKDVTELKRRLIFRSMSFLRKGDYILNKNPINSLAVKALINAFPDAKFIVCYRNPYNTVSSLIHSMPLKEEIADRLRPVTERMNVYPAPKPHNFVSMLHDNGYTQAAIQYSYVYDYLHVFFKKHGGNHVFWFSFDRLVENPLKELCAVLEFMEIKSNRLNIQVPEKLVQKKPEKEAVVAVDKIFQNGFPEYTKI